MLPDITAHSGGKPSSERPHPAEIRDTSPLRAAPPFHEVSTRHLPARQPPTTDELAAQRACPRSGALRIVRVSIGFRDVCSERTTWTRAHGGSVVMNVAIAGEPSMVACEVHLCAVIRSAAHRPPSRNQSTNLNHVDSCAPRAILPNPLMRRPGRTGRWPRPPRRC
jgi:hypothetical protein